MKTKAASRRKPETPLSQIKRGLDRIWLQSRERSEALKATGYRCACCGVKQSAAKGKEVRLEVHHVDGCDRAYLANLVREHLLHQASRLVPLCEACHDAQHEIGGAK